MVMGCRSRWTFRLIGNFSPAVQPPCDVVDGPWLTSQTTNPWDPSDCCCRVEPGRNRKLSLNHGRNRTSVPTVLYVRVTGLLSERYMTCHRKSRLTDSDRALKKGRRRSTMAQESYLYALSLDVHPSGTSILRPSQLLFWGEPLPSPP